jgi:alpha-ketoglutarate-dependent taurine dioxygenase
MTFDTIKLQAAIGSQVRMSRADLLSGDHAQGLRALLEERGVLVFRGMDLNDEEEMHLASTLGTLRQDLTGKPIMAVTFDRKANSEFADYFESTFLWHVDGVHADIPPLATILTPRVLAPAGTGQTEFANTYASYEDLPVEEKQLLDGLKVAHTQACVLSPNTPPKAQQLAWVEKLGIKIQPMVWHHRSGRKSIVLGASAERVMGMGRAESFALIERMQAWMTQPQYVYRHEWQMGDVLMWNNTGTMHRVLDFDRQCGRRLHRVTLMGEESLSNAA